MGQIVDMFQYGQDLQSGHIWYLPPLLQISSLQFRQREGKWGEENNLISTPQTPSFSSETSFPWPDQIGVDPGRFINTGRSLMIFLKCKGTSQNEDNLILFLPNISSTSFMLSLRAAVCPTRNIQL